MKYNRFDLKIYRKFHKIIEKSQLRLSCLINRGCFPCL